LSCQGSQIGAEVGASLVQILEVLGSTLDLPF